MRGDDDDDDLKGKDLKRCEEETACVVASQGESVCQGELEKELAEWRGCTSHVMDRMRCLKRWE